MLSEEYFITKKQIEKVLDSLEEINEARQLIENAVPSGQAGASDLKVASYQLGEVRRKIKWLFEDVENQPLEE